MLNSNVSVPDHCLFIYFISYKGRKMFQSQIKLEFVFYVKTDVSPPIGVMQFCTESQVLVQQRGINSESK